MLNLSLLLKTLHSAFTVKLVSPDISVLTFKSEVSLFHEAFKKCGELFVCIPLSTHIFHENSAVIFNVNIHQNSAARVVPWRPQNF
jgi:hypothetical protein